MCGVIRGFCLMVPCLAALAAWPLMAAEEKKEPAEAPAVEKPADKPTEEKPAQKKPAEEKKAEKVDPFMVPEGTPEELIEYIKKVRKTPRKNLHMVVKARKALRSAAEHIIAAQPEEKKMTFAVQLKMQLLQNQEQLAEFADQLKGDGHEKYARLVRSFGLRIELARSERLEPQNRQKVIENVLRFLEESPPQQADIRLALEAGKLAELTGDNKLASNTYHSAARVFAASKEKKLADFAQTLEGTSRRLALLGNEMIIKGKLLGGETFDWSKYAGKVVLVDFWATWSGSSVAELSKMKKYYDRYHDKGFDIVGISCDRRLVDLTKFVEERKIPWAIVYGKDQPSPTVSYYGIMDIPTKILVGRDGKVILLNARGLKLKEALLKLFGPAEDKK